MFYHIPLNKVENRSIVDYRLMLHTIFNASVLMSGAGDFKHKTDQEEQTDLEKQIKYYKSKGFFNG